MILDGGAFYPDSTSLSFYQSPAWDDLAVKIHDDTHYMTSVKFEGVSECHHMIFSWKPLETIDLYINVCPVGYEQNMAPRTKSIASWTMDFTIAGNKWGDKQERGVVSWDHMLILAWSTDTRTSLAALCPRRTGVNGHLGHGDSITWKHFPRYITRNPRLLTSGIDYLNDEHPVTCIQPRR